MNPLYSAGRITPLASGLTSGTSGSSGVSGVSGVSSDAGATSGVSSGGYAV